ncbi:MAG: chitobiase/beta-hexosaminidase C-terminal domain-containing protein [Terrimicrobiaceae bacterium]
MRRTFLFVLQAGFCIGIAGAGEIEAPVVSVDSAAPSQQAATVTVTLPNPPAGTSIYYTTDGSAPSSASPSITSGESLLIGYNRTLKVQAISGAASTSDLVTFKAAPAGMVSAGGSHTLALRDDGTVWAWGSNSSGELGDGGTTPGSQPVQVMRGASPLAGIVAVAAGSNESFAVDEGGNVWAWGNNSQGQLGIGTTANATSATQVAGLSGIVGIASAQHHALALKSDGTVMAWGANASGQLGNGTTGAWVAQPVQVLASGGHLQAIVAVAAGDNHSLAIDEGGNVWAWGNNSQGQLGDSTSATKTTAVPVTGLADAVAISAGPSNSFALKNDGTAWAWGSNTMGELGNGTISPSSPLTPANLTPHQVTALTGAMAAVGNQSALGTDGTVWAWGENTGGRLGLDVANGFATLPLIVGLSTAPDPDLSVFGSGSQTVQSGSFSNALTVTATADGIAVPNALVNFVLTQGSGFLATDTASPRFSQILQVRTDSDGRASVFFQTPGSGSSQILAAIGGMGTYFSVLAQGTGVPAMPVWAYLSLGVLLFLAGTRFLPKLA